MAKNVLHTDDCAINSIRHDCICTCNLTLEGRYAKLHKENTGLHELIQNQALALLRVENYCLVNNVDVSQFFGDRR